MLVRTIAAFLGEEPLRAERHLARVSYLLWTKEKSADGLAGLINAIFGFETKVRQFQRIREYLNENNRLNGKLRLGISSGLGEKALTFSFGTEIELTHNDRGEIFRLMVDEKYLLRLKRTIGKYLGEFITCRLCVRPKSLPSLELSTVATTASGESSASQKYPIILGRTSWLPFSGANPGNFRIGYAKIKV
jgi:predicted component of type VI protein secretion system